MSMDSEHQFYLTHSLWSDPGAHAGAFADVPDDVAAIACVVQGLFVHDYFGAHLYPAPPDDIARASRATLPISQRLPTLHAFDTKPLTKARATSCRRVGTCRDFALLTCAILRTKGVPARVRCGFARYFHPPTYEDHWICESFDARTRRWKMVDAQLDAEHRAHLTISFDTCDLPPSAFMFPWQVWEAFGHDHRGLEAFGHGDANGLWFVRVALARDVLALAKHEVTDWDTWRDQGDKDKQSSAAAMAQCTQLAEAGRRLDVGEGIDTVAVADLVSNLAVPHWRKTR